VTRIQRLIVAGAALGLLAVFALPLWHIDLTAPQYPEGLGMVIRINTIQGARPTDLHNINSLNHYIGMHVIDPGDIPELRWMPRLVGVLVAVGVLAAVEGRMAMVLAWLAGCAIACVAGIFDFYRWEFDYGHHLDLDHAIIRVPGMSYQPPLVGSRQLLNFTATSYPASGTWVIGILFLLVIAILVLGRNQTVSRGISDNAALLNAPARIQARAV